MGTFCENKKHAYLNILTKKKKTIKSKKTVRFCSSGRCVVFWGGQGNSFGVAEVAASGFLRAFSSSSSAHQLQTLSYSDVFLSLTRKMERPTLLLQGLLEGKRVDENGL